MEVLYSLDVGYTLVSVRKLDDKGFELTFLGRRCTICGPMGEHIGAVPKVRQGLYHMAHGEPLAANSAKKVLISDQFHCQMGHISSGIMQCLVEKEFETGICLEPMLSGDPVFCKSCMYAKATCKSVLKACESDCAKIFGEEVHSNCWGPAPVENKGGKQYYITYTDDCIRLTHLYLLHAKSDAFDSYKEYKAWCNQQLGVLIKVVHSDCGGEYLDKAFTLHLKQRGTEQKLTIHDTPAYNSVAEQQNCTIIEQIHALLHASNLPKFLWGEAACHVIWLMNRMMTKAVDNSMTPYEAIWKETGLTERMWMRWEGFGMNWGWW